MVTFVLQIAGSGIGYVPAIHPPDNSMHVY